MNSVEKKAFTGTISLFASSIFTNIFIFLERIILTRTLNTDQFGIFSLSLSIINFTLFLIYFGITTGILRFLSYYVSSNMKEYENGIKRFSYIYGYIVGLSGTIIILLLSPFLGRFYSEKYVFYSMIILSPSIFFMFFTDVVSTVFLGYSRTFFKAFWRNIFFPLIRLIFFFFLFIFKKNILFFLLFYTISSFIIFLVSFYKKPLANPPYKYKINDILKFSIPIAIIGFYGLLMGKIDNMMIGKFMEIKYVGFYSLAFSLAVLIKLFLNSSSEPYLPLATKLVEKNNLIDLNKLLLKVNKLNMIITFYIMISGLFIGPKLIPVLFGSDYAILIGTFKLLSIGFFLQSFFGLFAPTLTAIGDTLPLLFMSVLSGFINIIFNVILIKKFGIIGAASATIISETFFSIIGVIYLKLKHNISSISIETSQLLFFFLISGLIFSFYNNFILITVIFIILIIFLFFFIKYIFREYKIIKGNIE